MVITLHSLHGHHPLPHQSALLNLHQQTSNIPPHTNSESTNSISTSCAISPASNINTPVTHTNSISHGLHHPYLSALNSFPNLSALNNFPYGPLAAAAHHAVNNGSQQSSQSTIHHHPLFGSATSAHPPNFGALIAEHSSNLGLPLPNSGSNSNGSLSNNRRSSDTVLQMDALANKNFLSAAGLTNVNSLNNSALNQKAHQQIQQLQNHLLHQNHLQQLHLQRLNRNRSNDSDNSDSEEHFEMNNDLNYHMSQLNQRNQLNIAQLNHLNQQKNKEKAKELDHSLEVNSKKKEKRELELQSNNKANKQNGHCNNNNKLDYHEEKDDSDDDYSNYNKKKIFIFSKQRRQYQTTSSSSNNTSSSNFNNENGRKQNHASGDPDFQCESHDESENEVSIHDDCVFLEEKNESVKKHRPISSAVETGKIFDKNYQQKVVQNELNSSINSAYSTTGSVMSCCGTTLIDVNSTNEIDEEKIESSACLEESNDIQSSDLEDLFDQSMVLQKQADSTNLVRTSQNTINNNSTSNFPLNSKAKNDRTIEKKSKKSNKTIKQLIKGVCGLSEYLNRADKNHLIDCILVAFLKDNHGKVENCIDKLNQVHNEMRTQNINRNELCGQIFVNNQITMSKHQHRHRHQDNGLIDSHDHSSFFDKPFNTNKNESNLSFSNSSMSLSSSLSDQEHKENNSSGYYQLEQVKSKSNKPMRSLLNKTIF